MPDRVGHDGKEGVIPAKAGIQGHETGTWIPACAGMTVMVAQVPSQVRQGGGIGGGLGARSSRA